MPTATTARRMFDLLEPVCLVTFFADECNAEMAALGHRTYWDGYFASRAAFAPKLFVSISRAPAVTYRSWMPRMR